MIGLVRRFLDFIGNVEKRDFVRLGKSNGLDLGEINLLFRDFKARRGVLRLGINRQRRLAILETIRKYKL